MVAFCGDQPLGIAPHESQSSILEICEAVDAKVEEMEEMAALSADTSSWSTRVAPIQVVEPEVLARPRLHAPVAVE